MHLYRFRWPLVTASLVGWVALITIDVTLIISGKPFTAYPLHSIAVGLNTALTVSAVVWLIGLRIIAEIRHHRPHSASPLDPSVVAVLERISNRLIEGERHRWDDAA